MKGIDQFLPLQEPTLYILLSLRSGEKHGYAILKEVAALSNHRVKLSTGTLYGALYRLLDQGFVEQVISEDASRHKKTYRLTLSGTAVLAAEMDRMQQLLGVNKRVLAKGEQS